MRVDCDVQSSRPLRVFGFGTTMYCLNFLDDSASARFTQASPALHQTGSQKIGLAPPGRPLTNNSTMSREELESEALSLFIGIGLTEQTAKCAALPAFACSVMQRWLVGLNGVSSTPPHCLASLCRCRQAIVKPKFRQALVNLIKEAGVVDGCPKAQGALLYTTASKVCVQR